MNLDEDENTSLNDLVVDNMDRFGNIRDSKKIEGDGTDPENEWTPVDGAVSGKSPTENRGRGSLYLTSTDDRLTRALKRGLDGPCSKHTRMDASSRKWEESVDSNKTPSMKLEEFVRGRYFSCGIGVIIVLNAVAIGFETDSMDGDAWYWLLFEVLFNFIFLIELALRIAVEGASLIWDNVLRQVEVWNVLDVILVVTGLLDLIISISGFNDDSLDMITMLRLCRLFRLARLVRLVKLFRELWLFVCGVASAITTVLWGAIVVGIVMFITATFLVRSVGYSYGRENSADFDPFIHKNFGTVGKAAVTLFQIITLDNWREVVSPIVEREPSMMLFFMMFISITSYALMAVIVATVTEELMGAARSNELESYSKREKETRSAIMKIHQVFLAADVDGNGLLSKDEFTACVRNPCVVKLLHYIDVSIHDACPLFDILDYDNTGFLTSHEFVEGCLRSRGGAKARDILELECGLWRQIRNVSDKLKDMEITNQKLHKSTTQSLKKMDQKLLAIVKAISIVNPAVSAWMSPLWEDENLQNLKKYEAGL